MKLAIRDAYVSRSPRKSVLPALSAAAIVLLCATGSVLAQQNPQTAPFPGFNPAPPAPQNPAARPQTPAPPPQPAQAQPAPAQPAPQPTQAQPPAPAPAAGPAAAQPAPQNQNPDAATQPQTPPVKIGNLSLQNASLTEVIDQLARQLHFNYILDPAVKGSVVLNTYGDTSNMDARNLLDLLLRINGAAMVQEGDIYRIVPMKQVPRILKPDVNPRNIPDDEQIMLNLVFLKFVTVDELTKVLTEFIGENASLYSYSPANLLFILDSRRNMRRTMDLITMFDSDTFANQRVRLFEVKNTKPSDLVKDLDNVMKAVSLDGKNSTVRFLPVDRINTLIAVSPNPGVFATLADWIIKLDIPVKITAGGSSQNYVYRVRYGRAECLSLALNSLFGYNAYSPGMGGFGGGIGGFGGGVAYPQTAGIGLGVGGGLSPYGSAYGGNYGNSGLNTSYGASNSFNNSFGGSGGCLDQGMGGGAGYGGGFGGGYGGAYGYPVFGGYAAQVPANLAGQPASAATSFASPGAPAAAAGTSATPPPPVARIVANPLDNALLIQADAQQLQDILKILKDLDIPPRQILLEAKIYSVDLAGSFASGVTAQFQKYTGTNRQFLGSLTSAAGVATTNLSVGTLVGQSRELLLFLNAAENQSRTHVLSEPSLIATDSIPATITVGTEVPVQTSTASVSAGTSTVTQSISSHNTGVTMQVNARVNPSGVVTLIINQEVSQPAAGSDTLTPSFDQQVVQTQVTVQDGDTIAIGGLISENSTNSVNGIPGLIHIPIVGALFGNKSTSHSRSELIIFMTPHVILDESDLIEASDQLKQQVKKLRKIVQAL